MFEQKFTVTKCISEKIKKKKQSLCATDGVRNGDDDDNNDDVDEF